MIGSGKIFVRQDRRGGKIWGGASDLYAVA